MPLYKRAPITEAVIELRYDQLLEKEAVDKLNNRFKGAYAKSEKYESYAVSVTMPNTGKISADAVSDGRGGFKLTSGDQSDLLLVTAVSMTCSRLAPYLGWEPFYERAQRDWAEARQQFGYRKLSRVGVRFINRIDVPAPGATTRIEDYLSVYPKYSEEVWSLLNGYAMQIVSDIDGYRCMTNSGLVPSPVIGHISFLLDIDVAKVVDVPQAESELWEMIPKMRLLKNRLFETSITQQTRNLFE